MTLETITRNLKDAYRRLVPGTMLHVDQLTNERRLNLITKTGGDLRNQSFYTADGNLYTVTVRKGKVLWGITREPQNLVLQNIEDAFEQLTRNKNYFPNAAKAKASLEYQNTVVVDVKGLQLAGDDKTYGYFVINPKKVKTLNSQQRLAATRIFGPNDQFEQNMEMFAEAGKVPWVFVLMPDYVKNTLKNNAEECLARASWLDGFVNGSVFSANVRNISSHGRVRGVQRHIASPLTGEQIRNQLGITEEDKKVVERILRKVLLKK